MSIRTLQAVGQKLTSWTVRERTSLTCYRLPTFDAGNWDEVVSLFERTPACRYGQYWLPNLEPRFLPGKAHVGYDDSHFWVMADFEDNDIFNPAVRLNEHAYKMGDVFEIFLRPLPGERYIEFHVTPDNHPLQLWFPRAMRSANDPGWKLHAINEPSFHSQTQVLPEENRWRVLAAIPYVTLNTAMPRGGDEWLFSFGRYDYTRGIRRPTISSTSPHRFPNFHHQHEWGCLTFSDKSCSDNLDNDNLDSDEKL